jgi:pyruvate dehydrogenase E2 component (dihydrolipoamide acetyltransferase)
MATIVKMPKVGLSEESAIISRWHMKKGDVVKKGETLFTIETDKSAFDIEAEADGTILEIFFDEGDEVRVLTDVCIIGEHGEDITDLMPKQQDSEERPETEERKDEQLIETTDNCQDIDVLSESKQTDIESDARIKISPRAKRLAEKSGIDPRSIVGTGPQGRIIERNIINFMEKGPVFTPAALSEHQEKEERLYITSGSGIGGRVTTKDLAQIQSQVEEEIEDFEEVPLSNIRKIIARNMLESLANTAQLTIHTSFDATEVLSYREKIKNNRESSELNNITINDIILYAVSRTLMKHKSLNAHMLKDKLLIYNDVNLGVAVDTDRGLMVPTVFKANRMSLNEISEVVKGLVDDCRRGAINPDLLKGGTFTVTNLGSLGVEAFTPILNPPQVAILGVNSITYKVKPIDGDFKYYPAMGLSLTFDHRAVDGAPAARFLKELANNLENFTLLLAK